MRLAAGSAPSELDLKSLLVSILRTLGHGINAESTVCYFYIECSNLEHSMIKNKANRPGTF